EAQSMLAEWESKVRERIGASIFGADEETLEGVIVALLLDRKQSLATVELNTGGMLSSRLTLREVGGQAASTVFRGGLVLSDPHALGKALDLDLAPTESIAVVTRAAQRIRKLHETTLGLAVMLRDASDGSGVNMVVALVSDNASETLERSYGGHAGLAAQWTTSLALGLMWKYLKSV
ncbi:MAG: CinA family protein, partial [Anaerolineae bacterium]